MIKKSKIYIKNDEAISLVNSIKEEIETVQELFYLGVFNGKIPVLLKSRRSLRDLDPGLFSELQFRIYFADVLGEWEIHIRHETGPFFTFYIPNELKRIATSNSSPLGFIQFKQDYLSSLSFTYKYMNSFVSITIGLDSLWIDSMKRLSD